jgi:hypothetical protein
MVARRTGHNSSIAIFDAGVQRIYPYCRIRDHHPVCADKLRNCYCVTLRRHHVLLRRGLQHRRKRLDGVLGNTQLELSGIDTGANGNSTGDLVGSRCRIASRRSAGWRSR